MPCVTLAMVHYVENLFTKTPVTSRQSNQVRRHKKKMNRTHSQRKGRVQSMGTSGRSPTDDKRLDCLFLSKEGS